MSKQLYTVKRKLVRTFRGVVYRVHDYWPRAIVSRLGALGVLDKGTTPTFTLFPQSLTAFGACIVVLQCNTYLAQVTMRA